MKHILIRTCQIGFIAAVALLYVVKVLGGFTDAWQEVGETSAFFAADRRAQLRGITRTIGNDRIVFLFHPDKHLFLYRDEQGAEHIAHDRLHLFRYDRALDFYYEDEVNIPTPQAKTLPPSPKLTAALNALRRTPAYPLSLRDRIGLAFDIMAWWW